MRQNKDLRQALLRTDPLLGRYDPLERILLAQDFEDGIQGWQTYFPDYDGWDDYSERYPHVPGVVRKLEQTRDPKTRWDRRLPIGPRPVPMLSSLTSWDIGTNGSWSGTYALKIPTIAKAGTRGVALKRLACPWRGKFRIETYFTYKAEPSDYRLGELDVRSFGVLMDAFDLHHIRREGLKPMRWNPGICYHNAQDGKLIQRWQVNLEDTPEFGERPYLPDGRQDLGFNRAPTKYQWHYLRLTIHLAKHEYVDFHCYGQEFDVAGRKPTWDPPRVGWRDSTDKCPGLLLVSFNIVTNSDKRCFLYLDSIVISATED